MFLTTNSGTNWTNVSNGLNLYVNALAMSGNIVFAGTDFDFNGFVFLSTNYGLSWAVVNQGLPNSTVLSLGINENYIFAGTQGSKVWRRPLSEMTPITIISVLIPKDFSLSQNYPNPFNPATNIKFALPKSASVTLVIYDFLGKEVAILVNESLKPGTYETDWNASNYPSGVYFYKLTAGNFVDTKKMILLK